LPFRKETPPLPPSFPISSDYRSRPVNVSSLFSAPSPTPRSPPMTTMVASSVQILQKTAPLSPSPAAFLFYLQGRSARDQCRSRRRLIRSFFAGTEIALFYTISSPALCGNRCTLYRSFFPRKVLFYRGEVALSLLMPPLEFFKVAYRFVLRREIIRFLFL